MPAPSDILCVLADRGTCSAEDLASALGCRVGSVLQMVHTEWWRCEQIAGPSGWLYRLRVVGQGYVPKVMQCLNE